jgi:hypothetical protein
MEAAEKVRKAAVKASYYRTQPGLIPGAQAIRTQRAHNVNQAMVISAQQKLGGPRVQTAYVDKVIAHNTGIEPDVPATAAGGVAKSVYSAGAYTHKSGWMPGCKMVCPTGSKAQPMGMRMKVAYTGNPDTEMGELGVTLFPRRRMMTARRCPPGYAFLSDPITKTRRCRPVLTP